MNEIEANTLDVTIVGDNLTSMCQLSWTLYNVTDSETTKVFHGNAVIAGENYLNWNGDNAYPWTYVAEQIGVTLI